MKIINRNDFLAMPEGTLFSKYSPCSFGDLQIKGENAGINDFYCQNIASAIEHNSSEEFFDALERAQKTGVSINMDFDFEGRDGMFDADQLFAVWEHSDVVALLSRLQQTLVSKPSS